MAKYWYSIRLSRAIKAEEIEDLKSELTRLFQTTALPEFKEETIQITTPLDPPEAGVALERFCIKHGPATFASGGKAK